MISNEMCKYHSFMQFRIERNKKTLIVSCETKKKNKQRVIYVIPLNLI